MSNTTNLTHDFGYGVGYGNNTLLQNPELCTLQTCDLSLASFLYLPNVAGNAIYAGIFGIYFIAQLYLGIKNKIWGYMVAILLGLLLEIIGYIARILLHHHPFDNNYFLMYLITLTIAPAFLTAGIYLCLSRIVVLYGTHLSRFAPRTYTLVFCTCDIVSLVLQALGGGIASSANTESDSNLGKNIMLAGLGFQVFSLILFGLAAGEFALRVSQNKRGRNPRYEELVSSKLFKAFLFGLFTASVTILIRSIYRCIELSGGFNGTLFVSDEAVFMVLEGVMIVIATSCLTFLHPAMAFRGAWGEASFKFRKGNGAGEEAFKMERVGSDEDVGGEYRLSKGQREGFKQ